LRIQENWRELVRDEDTVLIPGDISWAMQLQDACADLEEIGKLPGQKILCKGNHDYWWNSITRVRSVLPGSIRAVQHSAVDLGDAVVCGTRGWTIPTKEMPLGEQDEKIFRREVERLRLALEEATSMAAGRPLVVMTHFPPLLEDEKDTVFSGLMEQYRVHTAVYGHLHGNGIRIGFSGEHRGVQYHLVSCDSIGFAPKIVFEK
jgi:predicted phosphohydrolase